MDDDASLTQLTIHAARTLRRLSSVALEPFGLSPHQARALGVIARHCTEGRLRLSDLAEHLRIAPRSATEVVDALEQRGLVARAPNPDDRRAIVLRLTDEGSALRAQIEQGRAEQSDQFFAKLSADERADLAVLLRKALGDGP
ncbi:MarR family transcriptional regulator [Leekyejoonella antrihumi]|uniref:MarR family transcriptional regulator n=1 Tax=Leekyejoonella antrihumi TaxID=1660198 RepID=A0A563DTN8_9MICO|nr:MarR family transcriptional regulator [Leekyejoonella antrihumi]